MKERGDHRRQSEGGVGVSNRNKPVERNGTAGEAHWDSE